jgi:hypothetical protein
MIVYGDSERRREARALAEEVDAAAAAVIENPDEAPPSLAARRALLVTAGMAEQALEDVPRDVWSGPSRSEVLDALRRVTTIAGRLLVASPDRARRDLPILRRARTLLASAEWPLRLPVGVQLPEGYAFTALFPEVFAIVARRWMRDRTLPRPIAVVGVRPTGTGLSATVAAALENGRDLGGVHRFTVRPEGDPLDRRATVYPSQLRGARRALVVDEDPGPSGGPCMSAIADGLEAEGCDVMAFLARHDGGLGPKAPDAARERWQGTRVLAPLPAERCGLHLRRELGSAIGDSGADLESLTVHEAGSWRARAFGPGGQGWPAVHAEFARVQLRARHPRRGEVRFKFAGFAAHDGGVPLAERVAARAEERARLGFGPPVLGHAHGFVAFPWVEGVPLHREDADADLLHRVGAYLAAIAGPPLSRADLDRARGRLAFLLETNAREARGHDKAGRAGSFAAAAMRDPGPCETRAAGDGRPAPHEWIRAQDGRVLKVGGPVGDVDHTHVGRQPLVWDVAGAIVEWAPDAAGIDALFAGLEAGGVARPDPGALAFHQAAYAALELARADLTLQRAPADECPRLRTERARYARVLDHLIEFVTLPIAA